ncbi:MAG: type II toxin-antitoxin system Phd/YefM family antitoxin [Treponema sp.]|nr:type II toxin-antitoxin system Phd/YefM family antitoxin [Treponema sp.]
MWTGTNYSEARQNFSTVLNAALKEEVIITRKDGKFKLISMNESKKELRSPLEDIKRIKTNIAMNEILEAIRQGREDREYKKSGSGRGTARAGA